MVRNHPYGHDRAPFVRSRLGTAMLAGCVALSLSAAGCSGSDSDDGSADRKATQTTSPAASLLTDAGFVETQGVQIDRSDSQRGQDTLVRFVLIGKAEDVDKALDAAKWAKPFKDGNTVSQEPLPGSGVELWKKVESSSDTITVDGTKLNRLVVRGTQDGATKLHVWAFTT